MMAVLYFRVSYVRVRWQETTTKRQFRTATCTVPPDAQSEARSLMVRECMRTYTSDWHEVNFKYSAYSGSYLRLNALVLLAVVLVLILGDTVVC